MTAISAVSLAASSGRPPEVNCSTESRRCLIMWATNLGVNATTSNTVTEFSASTGAVVNVIEGTAYGFNQPNSITILNGTVWVGNQGNSSVTEFRAR